MESRSLRGRPLPWAVRERIAAMRGAHEPTPYRKIARALGISKTTVQKYAAKFGTETLNGGTDLLTST